MSFREYGSHYPSHQYQHSVIQNQENTMPVSRKGKEPMRTLDRSASHFLEEGRLANIPAGDFEQTQYSKNPSPVVNPSRVNYGYANSSTMNMGHQQTSLPVASTSSAPFDYNLAAPMESTNATRTTEVDMDEIYWQFFAQFEMPPDESLDGGSSVENTQGVADTNSAAAFLDKIASELAGANDVDCVDNSAFDEDIYTDTNVPPAQTGVPETNPAATDSGEVPSGSSNFQSFDWLQDSAPAENTYMDTNVPPPAQTFDEVPETNAAATSSGEFASGSANDQNVYGFAENPTPTQNTYTDANLLPAQTFDYNCVPTGIPSQPYNTEGMKFPNFTNQVVIPDAAQYDTRTLTINPMYLNNANFQPVVPSSSGHKGALNMAITQPAALEGNQPQSMPQNYSSTSVNVAANGFNEPPLPVLARPPFSVPYQMSRPDPKDPIEINGWDVLAKPVKQTPIYGFSQASLASDMRKTSRTTRELYFCIPGQAISLIHCIGVGSNDVNPNVDNPLDVVHSSLALPVQYMLFEIYWPGYPSCALRFRLAVGRREDIGRHYFKQDLAYSLGLAYKYLLMEIRRVVQAKTCPDQPHRLGWGAVGFGDLYMSCIRLGDDGVWRPSITAYNEVADAFMDLGQFGVPVWPQSYYSA